MDSINKIENELSLNIEEEKAPLQQNSLIEKNDDLENKDSILEENELSLNRERSSSTSTTSSTSIKSSTSINSDLTLLTALETVKNNKLNDIPINSNELIIDIPINNNELDIPINNNELDISINNNELIDILINELSGLENSETNTSESPSTPKNQNKTILNYSSASKVHTAHLSLETVSLNTTAVSENDVVKALHKVISIIKNTHKRTALGHIIGSLKALILIVNNYYYNEKIIKNCLKIIFQLAKNEITRKAFGDYGISQVLVQALNHHISNEAIARHGLRTVCNLTYENDNNRIKLVHAGVIETVLNLLSNNINSEKVAYRGIWCISNLCFVDNENKKSIGRNGCNLVINSLSIHQVKRDLGLYIPTFLIPISEKIAMWGCRAIVDLAEKNPTNQCFLGEIGACDEVVRCLEAYSSKKDVSKWALAASTTLMTDSILNTQKFAQLHLVKHILKQLKLCKYSDALLTEIGLSALYHLSLDINSKREIIELGGIELVKQFPTNLGNRNDCLISLTCNS